MVPRAAIAKTLRSDPSPLIVCHEEPDGDALGSSLALAHALRKVGGSPAVACADGVPDALAFLPGAAEVLRAVPDPVPPLVVTIECSTVERAGPLAAAVVRARTVVAIDHHAEHAPYASLTDWDPTAAAAGEQVADLIRLIGVPFDRPIAISLLTALLTDTGVFRFQNTSPRTLRLAAEMVEYGASIAEIVRSIYEEVSVSSLRLLGAALAGLRLHEGGRVATAVVTPKMAADAGAEPGEAAGIAAALRTVRGVRLAIAFDATGPEVRISVRARDGARADTVAAVFGGGGHPGAAGAETSGRLEEAVQAALDAASREIAAVRDLGGTDD